MKEIYGFDAFSPKEIAERVENLGVVKARLPFVSMMMLGILAGAFIGLGAMFYILILSDSALSFGIARLLSGLVFSLALILVIVGGAEVVTGNDGAIGQLYVKIATTKCSISFQQAFFSGMLCNVLVCLAVWMAMAGRSIIDKIFVIVFPVTTFVACGYVHSIANMYLIPMGMLLKESFPHLSNTDVISWYGFAKNLIPVILGNLTGGSVIVALIYYLIYRRNATN